MLAMSVPLISGAATLQCVPKLNAENCPTELSTERHQPIYHPIVIHNNNLSAYENNCVNVIRKKVVGHLTYGRVDVCKIASKRHIRQIGGSNGNHSGCENNSTTASIVSPKPQSSAQPINYNPARIDCKKYCCNY